MFEIQHHFASQNQDADHNLDEASLRYNLFLGSLILKTESNSIIIDWDWVPIFDFAICLAAICDTLLEREIGEAEFEFTESDEKLIFQKDVNSIKISSTFSDETLKITPETFETTVGNFYKAVVFEILSKNVSLKNNDAFLRYLKEAENR